MSVIGKFKLSDALAQFIRKGAGKLRRKPVETLATTAEQTRELKEGEDARNAEASIRARMVEIGRGNQQAGRQGQ
jgi:hypothetical protein